MKIAILLSICLGINITLCNAQNSLYINNESDTAVGKFDTITLTGNISSFIITQARLTPLNQIYYEGPIFLNKAHIDSFYCRRTFFRNFIMRNCTLKSTTIFDGISSASLLIDSNIFQQDLKINNRFKDYQIGNFSFSKNKVLGKFLFSEITFRSSIFDFTTFSNVVKFENCVFNNISFHGVDFQDSIICINSSYGNMDFISSNFHKTLNLFGTTISGKLSFDSCRFAKGLILSSISPNAIFSFKDITLPDTLDLSNNPLISNAIDLTNVHFHDGDHKCSIFLYKTDIPKIQLDYKYFELKFKILDGHEVSENEKEVIYEALLKNFKDRGQNESYELLDIEYKNFKNGWFILPRYWNCHGYRKQYIFIWTVVLLILFTVITFFKIDKLTRFVYKINHIPDLPSLKQTYKLKHRRLHLLRRIWLSFTYTTTIFFLFLLKVENIKFKNWKGVTYLIVMYAIGLVCIAYMANFILQK